jgi:hypothetical protein
MMQTKTMQAGIGSLTEAEATSMMVQRLHQAGPQLQLMKTVIGPAPTTLAPYSLAQAGAYRQAQNGQVQIQQVAGLLGLSLLPLN